MKTQNGGLRQLVFKGLRDDKKAEECIDNTIIKLMDKRKVV